MTQAKAGRNDPCPCGSGKKYKACCMKNELPQGKKKFKASVIGKVAAQAAPQIDLMERTFGASVIHGHKQYEAPKEAHKEPEHFDM